MSIESFYQTLEIGSIQERHNALFNLHKLANNATSLDVQRLLFCLLQDDSEIVCKTYLLIASLVLHDAKIRKQLLQTSTVYNIVNKTFTNGSNKKIFGALNLLAAILDKSLGDMGCLSSDYYLNAKTQMRTSGCLGQMCKLFLQSNRHNKIWKILCLCLAECCFDVSQNKAVSSHILLKCLQELVADFKSEVVILVRALIENFPPNQEKFVQFKGIRCFTRNLLREPGGIELLYVAVNDCQMAFDEAKLCKLDEVLLDIKFETPVHPKIKEWCNIALWRFSTKLIPDDENMKNADLLQEINEELSIFGNDTKLPVTVCDVQVSPIERETASLSHISKFDAIISRVNDDGGVFSGDPFNTSQKQSILDTTFMLPECDKKFHGRLSKDKCVASRRGNLKIFSTEMCDPSLDKENVCQEDRILDSGDDMKRDINDYSEFCPKFSSTPKTRRENNATKENSSYVIPKITRKRGYGFFQKFKDVTNLHTPQRSKVECNLKDRTNINDDVLSYDFDNDVTLMSCDESQSTMLKVRKLAKSLIDLEEKKRETHPDVNTSFIHILSSDENNRLRVKSVSKKLDLSANCYNSTSSSLARYKNIRTYSKKNVKIHDYICANNNVNIENKNVCLSLAKADFMGMSGSINGQEADLVKKANGLETVICLLKVGISLYGCNFQKIAQVLWPKENCISPLTLYEIFQAHIVNHNSYNT